MVAPTTEQLLAKMNNVDANRTIKEWIAINILGSTTVKAAALTSMRNNRARLMRERGLDPEK